MLAVIASAVQGISHQVWLQIVHFSFTSAAPPPAGPCPELRWPFHLLW